MGEMNQGMQQYFDNYFFLMPEPQKNQTEENMTVVLSRDMD